MSLQFESLDLDRQEAYTRHLRQSLWEASDYSFINIWGWGPEYGLEWAWSDGLIWLRQIFLRNYDFEYSSLTPELVQKALDMQGSWCEWRDCNPVDYVRKYNVTLL